MKSSELLNLIKTRRSIRAFKKSRLNKKQIDMILEAGRWAPSGWNSQPWKFIVIQDSNKINEIAKATDIKFDNSYISGAAAIIAVIKIDNNPKSYTNIGTCIQNMLLMIHSLKLGACCIGSFEKEKVSKLLKIPENLELSNLIIIGISKEKPKINRKPLKNMVSFEHY